MNKSLSHLILNIKKIFIDISHRLFILLFYFKRKFISQILPLKTNAVNVKFYFFIFVFRIFKADVSKQGIDSSLKLFMLNISIRIFPLVVEYRDREELQKIHCSVGS